MTRGRPPIYDWDDLIKKSLEEPFEHDFVAGRDFHCTPASFGMLVRRTARVRNLNVHVSVDDDHVYFVFTK